MLLQLTVAFLSGSLLGASVPYLPRTVLLFLAVGALALALLERRGVLSPRHGLALYLAVLAGLCHWTLIEGHRRALPPGEDAQVVIGTVSQPVDHGPGRLVFVLDTQSRDGHPLRVRVTWRDPDGELRRGDIVELQARLRPPGGALNFGGFDHAAYLRRAGIDAVASVTGEGRVRVDGHAAGLRWMLWRHVDGWRAAVVRAAEEALTGPSLGVFLGMIVGESGFLTSAVRDDFMATGTVHILSISGSHLGLVAFLSFGLFRTACLRLPHRSLLALSRRLTATRLAALLTLVPVAFYTALAGAEVATVRSFLMIGLFLLTVWLGQERHLLPALACAALLIVLHAPSALFEISFQLSFLSVLAIALLLLEAEESPLSSRTFPERVQGWLRDYLRLTVGITLFTLPLVAYYFNQVAWLGLAANLLVVPFAGFVLVPVGLISAVGTLLLERDVLVLGGLNQMLGDLLLGTVRWLARVPGAEWHVASPSWPAIVAYYGLLVLVLRGSWPVLRTCAGVGLFGLVAVWMWSPRPWVPGELRVTFLDVGQGDATVLELPGGETVLIDGGAAYDTFDVGRSVVAPYLWDRGIRRLDHVVATHPQLDHVGGLISILQKFEVGRYWDNGLRRDEEFYRRLMGVVADRRFSRTIALAGQTVLASEGCRLTVLNPMEPAATRAAVMVRSGSAINNASVVLQLACPAGSFLFPGDIEVQAIEQLKSIGNDLAVLKVPHHGARSSHDPAWIDRLRPEVAVISVGRYNAYGHPARAVLATFSQQSVRVLRTDQDGAVSIAAPPGAATLAVTTGRGEQLTALGDIADWHQEGVNLRRLLQRPVP